MIGSTYIPLFDLIAALFCAFCAAEIDANQAEFGIEDSCRMTKWLYGMATIFVLTVFWQVIAMPFMAIAMIVRFLSSLVVSIMFAIILKKNKGSATESRLLLCTLMAAATWLDIVFSLIGL